MCDIQAITGISILIGGFICLDESLSAHHWELIVNLAWFSSITHLSGLTVLRRYLQVHHYERYVRIFFMFVLLAMLLIAMVPTAFINWRSSEKQGTPDESAAGPKTPAICLFSIQCGLSLYPQDFDVVPFERSNAFQEMMISLFFLVIGFLSRTIKLSTRLSGWTREKIGNPVDTFLEGLYQKLDANFVSENDRSRRRELPSFLRHAIITKPTSAIIIVLRSQITLFNSMLAEVQRLALLFSGYIWSVSTDEISIAVMALSNSTLGDLEAQTLPSGGSIVCKVNG